jgi:Flp pilus assembly protein TadG
MVAGMRLRAILSSLHDEIRRFGAAESGNVMFTFALATIPMIGFVGAAVDYSRGNSAKAAMQSAIDSTALMLSRQASSLTQAQLNQKATDIFKSLLHRPEVTGLVVTPTYTPSGTSSFKINVSAKGRVPTTFTKVVGQDHMDITVTAQVVWGMKKLELALALDNTGSMDSANKMTELKKAAKDLIQSLKKVAQNDNDIKIAIVPFAQEVNVGTDNVNATWLKWDDWNEENGSDTSTTTCTGGNGRRRRCTTSTTWTPADHKTWNGCVMDRDQSYDVLDTTPSTTVKATLFPTIQADNCPESILPLTSVKAHQGKLISKIEQMKPVGTTNVTIGLAWGWHVLTPNSPFTEGTAPDPETDKVIVLLTDGENTENRWTKNSNDIDARTRLVCTNVKAAGIKLYTIRVIDGNATLLQQCATRSDMYFNVQNASQLNSVFAQIANSLANLRIAK